MQICQFEHYTYGFYFITLSAKGFSFFMLQFARCRAGSLENCRIGSLENMYNVQNAHVTAAQAAESGRRRHEVAFSFSGNPAQPLPGPKPKPRMKTPAFAIVQSDSGKSYGQHLLIIITELSG